jgi:GNAT superfamily N-acetyltransferase
MTEPDIQIRQARQDDVPALVTLNTGLFELDARAHDRVANLDWPRQHAPTRFASWLGDPTRTVLVAVTPTGRVIGYLSGRVETSEYRSEPVAVIGSIFVEQAERSSGTGTHLINIFRRMMIDDGVRFLEVTAYAANTDARRFYRRLGLTDNTITLQQPL